MKLMPISDVVIEKDRQLAINAKRSTDLSNELTIKRQNLEKLQIEFEVMLSRQKEEWEREKGEYTAKVNDLKIEVSKLEERRKLNLTPTEHRKEEIEKLGKIIQKREINIKKKEDEIEEKIELLEEKLTMVREQEREAMRVIQLQANAQKGIDLQKEQVSTQSREINDKIKASLLDISTREKDIDKRVARILLVERNQVEKEKELKLIEKGFIDRERQLKDRYETLERAEKEWKQKEMKTE